MKIEKHSIKAVYNGVAPYVNVTAYELSAINCSATEMSGYYGQESTLISDDPPIGYDFANWSVTGSNVTGNNVTFRGDITAKANYTAHRYNVTLQNDGHGTIAASKTTGNMGDTITLSNTPNNNYGFSGYTITGSTLTGNAFTIDTSNVTAKGWFSALPSFNLTLQTDGHGKISANKTTGYENEVITLSNTASAGYEFNNYTITGAALTGNAFKFNANDVTAKANFVLVSSLLVDLGTTEYRGHQDYSYVGAIPTGTQFNYLTFIFDAGIWGGYNGGATITLESISGGYAPASWSMLSTYYYDAPGFVGIKNHVTGFTQASTAPAISSFTNDRGTFYTCKSVFPVNSYKRFKLVFDRSAQIGSVTIDNTLLGSAAINYDPRLLGSFYMNLTANGGYAWCGIKNYKVGGFVSLSGAQSWS